MSIRPKSDEHTYQAQLVWTGASAGPTSSYQAYSREYQFRCGDKSPLKGSADPHFRGDPTLHNPEELLLVSLSSCHMLSYLALCARAGLQVVAYEDNARGTMDMHNGAVRFTDVVLAPLVTVVAGSNLERARDLHHDAHAECYIANSVNFPVRNEPTIKTAE